MAATTTAEQRAEISRRNGARSRGPTSPQGKMISSMNAIKHGMAARTPVLFDEDPVEFQGRVDGFFAAIHPRNDVERFLAHRAAVAAWKIDRGDRLEARRLDF